MPGPAQGSAIAYLLLMASAFGAVSPDIRDGIKAFMHFRLLLLFGQTAGVQRRQGYALMKRMPKPILILQPQQSATNGV